MPGFVGAHRNTGTTTQRGYGTSHVNARRRAFAALPEWSACCRCGQPMWKWAVDKRGKSALHFDHDNTRTSYLGFAHRTCNMRAGASKGARIGNARQRRTNRWTPPSRTDPGPGPGW